MKKYLILLVFILVYLLQCPSSYGYNPDRFDVDFNDYVLRYLRKAQYLELNVNQFSQKYDLSEHLNDFEPLKTIGFIGFELERIKANIHSAIQVKEHPNTYQISGKSKVGKNISTFSGTITLRSIYEFKEPITKHGLIVCRFSTELSEEGKGNHIGNFTGNYYLILSKIVDDVQKAKVYPHFIKNHTFAGSWKSKDSKLFYPVMWGIDYTFEDIQDIYYGITQNPDIDEKIIEENWESYFESTIGNSTNEDKKKYLEMEAEEWWK